MFNKLYLRALQRQKTNPFYPNVPFLYLKTPENQRFSDFFGRYRNGTLNEQGLSKTLHLIRQPICFWLFNSFSVNIVIL